MFMAYYDKKAASAHSIENVQDWSKQFYAKYRDRAVLKVINGQSLSRVDTSRLVRLLFNEMKVLQEQQYQYIIDVLAGKTPQAIDPGYLSVCQFMCDTFYRAKGRVVTFSQK